MLKRSWVEIDLNRVVNNIMIYKSYIGENQKIMAVVKADAYGHGDVEIAKVLNANGVEDFAVSNIEEAIKLRKSGIDGQILVLGYTPFECREQLIENDITQALISEEYAREIEHGALKAQLAIDTGMNRVGIDADDLVYCECVIRECARKFKLNGIFTHLCVADDDEQLQFTQTQIEKFKSVVGQVDDIKLKYVHCMNSAGGMLKESFGNLVRLGIVLYGLRPNYSKGLPEGIRPILTWKSVISMIKVVHPGESIGYGRSYVASREMRVATIPTGYADGYDRRLSNRGHVLVRGERAPIVGRVCMDQMMVDVTDIYDAKYGDEVTLLGESLSADDMANMIGTIGYEVVCCISKRVPRVYV